MKSRTSAKLPAYVVWGEMDEDGTIPEAAVLVALDANGLVSLNQEGRDLIVSPSQWKEIVKTVTQLQKEGERTT